MDEHDVTNVIHLAALQVPFVRDDPVLGSRVNVTGTVNVLEAVRRRGDADGPGRLRVLDRGAQGRRRVSEHAVRRLQARQRGHRGRLLRRLRRPLGRPAPAHALRPRPRPGADLGADRGDGRRRAAARRTRSRSAARCSSSTWPTPASSSCARARRASRAPRCTTSTGRWRSVEEIIAAIEQAAPEAAGQITCGEDPLPFPPEVDSSSFTELVGGPVSRPLDARAWPRRSSAFRREHGAVGRRADRRRA